MIKTQFIHLKSVDSTSRYLNDWLAQNTESQIIVCTADEQTAGYGQQLKKWLTNRRSAIFSIALPLVRQKMIPPSVSIRVASYIHRLLKRRVPEDLRVKWPNDLYTQEGKVAGILIEKTSSVQMDYMVIGVGINRGRIPKEVNDSYRAANLTDFALNEFLEELVLDLMSLNFNTGLSEAEMGYWQEYDLFEWEKPLLMVDKERSKVMTYSGLSSDGLALVSDENGLIRLFSGQSSLRLIEEVKQNKKPTLEG